MANIIKKTVKMCGADEKYPSSQLEKDSLNSLKRGVFFKKEQAKRFEIKP